MTKKITLLLASFLFISCTQPENPPSVNKEPTSQEAKSFVFDVRSAEEFQTGHLKSAINIPHTEISDQIANHVKSKDTKIMLYCGSGRRAGIAKKALEEIGYTNITNGGGYKDLKE